MIQLVQPELIYVSGPLSSSSPEGEDYNLNTAIDVAAELAVRGHKPFVPHLSLHLHRAWINNHGLDMQWEWWIDLDLRLLRAFDALYRIGPSKGADAELYGAKALGLKVYYTLEDVPIVGEGV